MKKFTFNVAVIKPALIPGIMLTVLLMLQALDPFDISQHGLAWVSGSSKAKLSSDIVILDIDPASQKKYGTDEYRCNFSKTSYRDSFSRA